MTGNSLPSCWIKPHLLCSTKDSEDSWRTGGLHLNEKQQFSKCREFVSQFVLRWNAQNCFERVPPFHSFCFIPCILGSCAKLSSTRKHVASCLTQRDLSFVENAWKCIDLGLLSKERSVHFYKLQNLWHNLGVFYQNLLLNDAVKMPFCLAWIFSYRRQSKIKLETSKSGSFKKRGMWTKQQN